MKKQLINLLKRVALFLIIFTFTRAGGMDSLKTDSEQQSLDTYVCRPLESYLRAIGVNREMGMPNNYASIPVLRKKTLPVMDIWNKGVLCGAMLYMKGGDISEEAMIESGLTAGRLYCANTAFDLVKSYAKLKRENEEKDQRERDDRLRKLKNQIAALERSNKRLSWLLGIGAIGLTAYIFRDTLEQSVRKMGSLFFGNFLKADNPIFGHWRLGLQVLKQNV